MDNDDLDSDIEETEEKDEIVELHQQTKRPAHRPKGSKNGNWEYKQKKKERNEAVRKLYEKGILHWKLDSLQKKLYDMYKSDRKELHWLIPRQVGKSTTVCCIAQEEAIRHPGIRMSYIAPETGDALDITEQSFDYLLSDCPDKLKPKFNSKRNRWEWQNGSFMKVTGTDNKNYKKIRGRAYQRIFVDEFCFMDDFNKVYYGCIAPTTDSNVGEYKIVFISTPPETVDHESNMILDLAEENNTLFTCTVYDSPRRPVEFVETRIIPRYKLIGGKNSVEFRREYMCERIADTSKLVIPEATVQKITEITAVVKRPDYYHVIEAFDWGVLDNNAGLFSFIDFDQQVIVIEDEMWMDGVTNTTSDIAKKINQIEQANWRYAPNAQIMRFCDNNLQIVNDMAITYKIPMIPTKKNDLQSQVMLVRQLLANGQIIINPKCTNLIEQIVSAQWKNANKSEFSRRNGHHYDLIAALIYLVRNANLKVNPYPVNYHIPKGSFISPKSQWKEADQFTEHLKGLFGKKKR